MFRRLLRYAGSVGVALLLVLSFGCHSPQGWSEGLTFEWDPTRPSPDTRLVLRQVRQRTVSGKACVEYSFGGYVRSGTPIARQGREVGLRSRCSGTHREMTT